MQAHSQQIYFNKVTPPDGRTFVHVTGITQDRNGYIWLSTKRGLCRYDGYQMITYKNNPLDPNSLGSDLLESVCVDSAGVVWMGTDGNGLEQFDPVTGIFKHFRNNPKDPGSVSDDWIGAVMIDREGTLWVGTGAGLDRYDAQTETFKHFRNNPGDSSSISCDEVSAIYEDKQGDIWLGTGTVYGPNKDDAESGGLNRMDKKTGTFTRYKHDPRNPKSLINNKVRAIFEDSKGTFWIGTAGDGLHTMDRKRGTFIRHEFDPAHPEKLSRPQLNKQFSATDNITFIHEDAAGGLWIGTSESGVNYFDPKTKRKTHYESERDTSGAFDDRTGWWAYTSRDGVLWISSLVGSLYRIDPLRKDIPHHALPGKGIHSFYKESTGILWLGTVTGIVRSDTNNTIVPWNNVEKDLSSIADAWTSVIEKDDQGNLLIGGRLGLSQWNPKKGQLTRIIDRPESAQAFGGNAVTSLSMDNKGDLWIGTFKGISFFDRKTGSLNQYFINEADTSLFGQNFITAVLADRNGRIWIGSLSGAGLNLFDRERGTFQKYLNVFQVNCIYEDKEGSVWVGTNDGLYKYDVASDTFLSTKELNASSEVFSIIEDDEGYLWLITTIGLRKIDHRRNETNVYGKSYGIVDHAFGMRSSFYKGPHGEIYVSGAGGYYLFDPKQLGNNVRPPEIIITAFSLADQIVTPGTSGPLKESLSQVKEIRLRHDQNIFSFDFAAIDYSNPDANQHLLMLENYDKTWHKANSERRAYYFNVPPGAYIFKVKAANSYGVWAEKRIEVIIMPPWWLTWWAYVLFGVSFITMIWAIIYVRSRQLRRENKILEDKVTNRTLQLQQSIENLKSTQAQLIQSEKMASLGELTAGIAHEIQNPLNFVNNFSDVNKELLVEVKDEMQKGNYNDAKVIIENVIGNEEKINHHGKRADAIVKGMLQHSRSSSSIKEATDINALADEYLRLAYHGLRARDNSFNAMMKTDFDQRIGNINVVPQDIGRVLLNLYTNAFYAVNEKMKSADHRLPGAYEPTVFITTKRIGDKILISVKDNGNGIPQKVVDKIFQPFFTTKPAGKGTGLGLSLAYDTVKAHGGELKVKTTEGEGSDFTIELPYS